MEQDAQVDWGGQQNPFVSSEVRTLALQTDVTNEVEKEIQEKVEVAEIRNDMTGSARGRVFLQALPEVVRSDTNDRTPIGEMQK